MTTSSTTTKSTATKPRPSTRPGPLGDLLRQWRAARRASQMTIALDAGISTRHLSFIETGRSQPSREALILIADALDIPLRERNTLLNAAGYAHIYTQTPLDDPAMTHMREVLTFMLDQHQPYPAMALDRYWNLIMNNQASTQLMGTFLAPDSPALQPEINAMRILFHPEGLRPHIVNWEEVGGHLMARLHREAIEHGPDEQTHALLDEISSYPGVPAGWRIPVPGERAPLLLTVHLRKGDLDLRMFTTITTLGTPQDITLQELRIEAFFAADPQTKSALKKIAATP